MRRWLSWSRAVIGVPKSQTEAEKSLNVPIAARLDGDFAPGVARVFERSARIIVIRMAMVVKARRPDGVPAPLGFRLRRMLSAHEIATLLLLLRAPVEVMAATPDVVALREVGLAQLVASEQGEARFALTVEGNAVLRVLGAG
jgi:hypothetical protein